MASRADNQQSLAKLTRALTDLTKSLQATSKQTSRQASGGGGAIAGAAASRGKGGILSRGVGSLSLGNLAALRGVQQVAQVAGTAASAGIINASRGGSFSSGLERGALEGINSVAPKFLQELTGSGAKERIANGAEARLNNATNRIAELGGADAISPEIRELIAKRSIARASNSEDNSQRNKRVVTDLLFGAKTISQLGAEAGVPTTG